MTHEGVSIVVRGKVQGVFFRQSTLKKAKELKIRGFVRNEKDGSVYIEASGNPHEMNEFLIWCKNGPETARVDAIEWKERNGELDTEFEIRH